MNKKEKDKIIDNCIFEYDQQPGESNLSFRLFNVYKNIGHTRNYKKTADICRNRSYISIVKLANKYQWKDRAEVYDYDLDQEMMVKLDEEIMQSRIRQQRIGSQMQKLAEKGIEMLTENVEDLSAADVTKLIDIGVKIERLALGASTEISERKIDAKVEMAVETIPQELAAEIGKKIAIESSKKMEINV